MMLKILLALAGGGLLGVGMIPLIHRLCERLRVAYGADVWRAGSAGRWHVLLPLTMGLASVLLVLRLEPTGLLLVALLLSSVLMALAVIDLDTGLLPDGLTLSLMWSGLLFHIGSGLVPLADAVLGAVAGYGVLWLVYWGYFALCAREGLGYGDMKLLAALGAWLGWMSLPQVLLISSLTGLLAGGILMLSGRLTRDQPLPFGPFLALSGWGVWVADVCF